jgi:8-oxo-dGTP pyrophosphatase MutT (NUDIX family)
MLPFLYTRLVSDKRGPVQSVQECLVRELQEELGVESKIGEIRFVIELHKDDTRFVELIWEATLLDDPIKSQEEIFEVSGHELEDIRWMSQNDVRAEVIKPDFLKNLF